ncbi:MAG: EAL domain-containing protein [Aquificota bacterium]|nr:EAL domain-containing protein [Aquificota bacterium]
MEDDLFELIAEKTDLIVVLYREKFLYANPSAVRLLGYTEEDIKDLHVWDLVHPSYREKVKEMVLKRISGEEGASRYAELPVRSKDGNYRVLHIHAFTVRLEDGPAGMAIGMDRSREKELALFLTHSEEVFSIVDREGLFRYVSPSVGRVFGWTEEELLNKSFTTLLHPEDKERVSRYIRDAFSNPGKRIEVDYRVKNKDGAYLWVRGIIFLPENWWESGLEGVIVNEKDITDKKFLRSLLSDITHHDPLTGLPNRNLFMEQLRNLLEMAKRRKEILPVLIIDIYKLKEINAVYGLSVGDKVLAEVARRLRGRLRDGDVVSRFFADRFGVIPTGLKSIDSLARVVSKIIDAFREPMNIENHRILVKINIGVALYPHDSEDAEDLIKRAEGALLRARDLGPGAVTFFSESTNTEIYRRLTLMTELQEAIEKGEIVPYYQPIFDIDTLRPVGVEILSRWRGKEVSPAEFIAVAENSGLIHVLGKSVLERALGELSSIRDGLHVAMNFSVRQFYEEDITDMLTRYLRRYNFPADRFWVEITESTAMREPEKAKDILDSLRNAGFKIAIDDFGTGHSSMNYLIEFEIDKLKIDKSFTIRMKESRRARSVVKAVVDLSTSIGALSLAEGVEDETILGMLRGIGCREAQGYYFASPMDIENLKRFLSRY